MLASDTAYPRLKTSFNAGELERWYSPTPEECEFCTKVVRGQSSRFGFLLTLKTFQRLGYFVTSDQIPDSIIAHLAEIEKIPVDREGAKALRRFTLTQNPCRSDTQLFKCQSV